VQSFAVLAIAIHIPFHRRLSWACAAPGDIPYDSLIETIIMCFIGEPTCALALAEHRNVSESATGLRLFASSV
jgi:hypothetical protein